MSDCNNKRQRSSSPSSSEAAPIEDKKPRNRRSRFSDKTAVALEPQEPPVVATDIISILNARLMGMNPAYDGLLGNVDIQQTATLKESRELFVGNVLATISDVILKDFLNRYFTVYILPLSYTSVYVSPLTCSLVLLFRNPTCLFD
jgi:hypothetical protein